MFGFFYKFLRFSGPWGEVGNGSGGNNQDKAAKAKTSAGNNSNGESSNNSNPWGGNTKQNSTNQSNGSAGNGGGSSNNNSGNDHKKNQTPQESPFDKIVKKIKNIFNWAAKNKALPKFATNKSPQSEKHLPPLIALILLVIWLLTGIYKVDPDENAVITYFGKYYKIANPGLNYYLPFPIGKVVKKSVTRVNTEEFGFSSGNEKYSPIKRNFNAESQMLTGDENIVDIEFQVQWQISDIKFFAFNIADPQLAIRNAAEGAMREIIARTPIAAALSDGKGKIELETKDLLQQILDTYGAGVRIVVVQLRRVDPPSQVIDAFRDVQTAKADKEKQINQAQSYYNDIIPKARGNAAQMTEDAQAYKQQIVDNAIGEAGRFTSVYNQYVKAKSVTKRRMYLETMEKIYQDMDKIFIDSTAAKSGVMPYVLPINQMPLNQSKN